MGNDSGDAPPAREDGIKTCPSCAETIQVAAKVCRFCGYDFESGKRPTEGAAQSSTNGMAVAALVLGIIGAVFGLIPITFFIALICGVLALIFGIVGWRKANRGAERKGMAIAGLVLSLVALGLGVLGANIVGDVADELDQQFEELEREFGD